MISAAAPASLHAAYEKHALLTRNTSIYSDPTRFWGHDETHRIYIIIDLKSFYASVECVERGLDPMTAKLVVADPTRGEGTICLAVSPALKKMGVKNRARIYEIPKGIDYITAPPQMAHYEECSAEIYGVYLQYFSKEDIHVYSCDESFIDVTDYLDMYEMTPKQLGVEVMNAILDRTGIRSSCGIGTNLYLAKIALDITAKHAPDFIGILDEDRYRELLWDHRPITDFWMVAGGRSRRLASMGLFTMHDIARAAMINDDALYKAFGVDAEILIDHAFGVETVGMKDIKGYRSRGRSLSQGQVLLRDYSYEEAEVVIKEMADQLCLQMTQKQVQTDTISFFVSYSHDFRDRDGLPAFYTGGTVHTRHHTASAVIWKKRVGEAYRITTRQDAPIRRIGLSCPIREAGSVCWQYSMFDENGDLSADLEKDLRRQETEQALQTSVLSLKSRFGKNAVLKGLNLEQAGTMMERNCQIGGHKAGTMDRCLAEKLQREGRAMLPREGGKNLRTPLSAAARDDRRDLQAARSAAARESERNLRTVRPAAAREGGKNLRGA